MDYGYDNLYKAVSDAEDRGDASAVDLAMRALVHFARRGTSVDTTHDRYHCVLAIDPKFYG